MLITHLRDYSVERSIHELANKVDPSVFEARFGAPVSSLEELVAANAITIGRLMEIAPMGTQDPTPSVYNLTMYAMAALLAVAFLANMMMYRCRNGITSRL